MSYNGMAPVRQKMKTRAETARFSTVFRSLPFNLEFFAKTPIPFQERFLPLENLSTIAALR